MKGSVTAMANNSSPARKMPVNSPSRSGTSRPSPQKKQKKGIIRVVSSGIRERINFRPDFDLTFLFLVAVMVIIGIIMMFSASYPAALKYKENSYFYVEKQAIFAAIGFVVMWIIASVDYKVFHVLAFPILVIALILLVLVLLLPSISETKRWITLGSITFQASEVAKFALILFLSQWGFVHFRKMGTFKYGVLIPIIVIGIIDLLLFREPHYSGIVIITVLGAIMMYLCGVRYRYFFAAGVVVALAVGYLVITNKLGYAMKRLAGWGQALNYTDKATWDNTYQTRNSLYAIGSGGFWGLGLGQSRQKYMYIPEAQNDFVFAVVCEELGFVGAAIILLLFALLVLRGFMISMNSKDKFGKILGVGLSAQIGLQVIFNIMVITDWLPNTGISLPFFSYGGTSLIMLMAQMGIILSISRTSNIERA